MMTATAKSERLNVRLTSQDDTVIRMAAESSGESVSDFLTRSAVARAQQVLADQRQFELDEASWDLFVAALDRPVEVRPELAALFQRPRLERA